MIFRDESSSSSSDDENNSRDDTKNMPLVQELIRPRKYPSNLTFLAQETLLESSVADMNSFLLKISHFENITNQALLDVWKQNGPGF